MLFIYYLNQYEYTCGCQRRSQEFISCASVSPPICFWSVIALLPGLRCGLVVTHHSPLTIQKGAIQVLVFVPLIWALELHTIWRLLLLCLFRVPAAETFSGPSLYSPLFDYNNFRYCFKRNLTRANACVSPSGNTDNQNKNCTHTKMLTTSLMWHFSSARHSSWSMCRSNGSRFELKQNTRHGQT